MSLATNALLKAALATWSAKTSLTDMLPDFVAWAHQEICRRLRAPVLYARASVTVNAETITAPSGFLAAKRFYLDLTPRLPLHLTDSGRLIDMTANLATGSYPTHFAVESTDTLAFAPLFSGSVTGQLLFYKAPTTLISLEVPSRRNKLYPMPFEAEKAKAQKYFAEMPDRVFSIGRMGSYLYSVDIDHTIDQAMQVAEKLRS